MNDQMLKIIMTRNNIPDLGMEAYLSTQPGMIGAIGFQRIAESHAGWEKKAKAAESQLKAAESNSAFQFDRLKDCARILKNKEAGAEISSQEITDVLEEIQEIVALSVADRAARLQKHCEKDDAGGDAAE